MLRSFARSCAITLALSAVLLRGFLPAGWMPNAGGTSGLVICTINGLRHISPPGEPAHKSQHQSVCPFAAAPPLASANALVLELASFALAYAATPEHVAVFTRTPDYSVHAARAPPSLA